MIEFVGGRSDEPDAKLAGAARAAYADLVKRATDREPEDAELDEMDAYDMAATVDFGLEAKQGLLDLRSENARLRAGHPAVPGRHQAAGLRRSRPGAGALQRQGPLRLSGGLPTLGGRAAQPALRRAGDRREDAP